MVSEGIYVISSPLLLFFLKRKLSLRLHHLPCNQHNVTFSGNFLPGKLKFVYANPRKCQKIVHFSELVFSPITYSNQLLHLRTSPSRARYVCNTLHRSSTRAMDSMSKRWGNCSTDTTWRIGTGFMDSWCRAICLIARREEVRFSFRRITIRRWSSSVRSLWNGSGTCSKMGFSKDGWRRQVLRPSSGN